jgi:hypothetical protein
MMNARSLITALVILGWSFGEFASGQKVTGTSPARLAVVSGDYPRVFFFRQSEGMARHGKIPFEEWEKAFSRLMGIAGKVLDEEVPNTSPRNVEFFMKFKFRHPEQLVMLHFNGNARDPRFSTEQYHPGHWLYHVGCKILSDVPAEGGTTEIRVEDPSLFLTNMGRYRDRNDDIGLCELDQSGRPNWDYSEQVQLVAIDRQKRTILVRRGCYGTTPRRFTAGRAYAAAHATEGPWGRNCNLLWYYNYATCCPRDAQGRSCADILVDELARWFGPEGPLSHFDGLEFDVLAHRPAAGRRPLDCNADGRPDDGVIDGINLYGIGVIRFLEDLRARLGDNKLILADGQQEAQGQRGFGILNGIESEGFPSHRDWQMRGWSTAINRHNFWNQNSHPPVFSYINHKYVEPGTQPGEQRPPEVPFSIHRLVFAAAVMTDAAICYSFVPPREEGSLIAVWDEFWAGEEKRLGWLGRPLGPTETLATQARDLLAPTMERLKRIGLTSSTSGVNIRWEKGQFTVTASNQSGFHLSLEIPVEIPSSEAYVELVANADPLPNYPDKMSRYATCTLVPQGWLMHRISMEHAWMRRRGESRRPLDPATGAILRPVGSVELAGKTCTAIQIHPPYIGKVGAVEWEGTVIPDRNDALHFATGMGERASEKSDGVLFRVEAIVLQGDRSQRQKPELLFEHLQMESRWHEHVVSLTPYGGQEILLRFIADAGPRDNATTDIAYWADVWIGPEKGSIPPRIADEQGTWLGKRPFTAGFFFDDLSPGKYRLCLRVEGNTPVHIQKLALHPATDARYRVFEHGLVLANPSHHEVRFDLEKIAPGRKFQRLKGNRSQDPTTNNGAKVGPAVVIPPKDALFLIEQ